MALCRFLKVTEQGYYKFKKKADSFDYVQNSDEIIVFNKWLEFDKAIGYKKIALQLLWDYGLIMNHKKVYRIMKELKIRAIQRKKRLHAQKIQKAESEYIFPNLLATNFKATRRYEKLCTDICEFPFGEMRIYLSAVIDLHNNEIVTFKRSRGHTGKLVLDTIKSLDTTMINNTIYHSDQGGEYKSYRFKKQLEKLKLKGSMSRAGTPTDNAPIEVFHSMIKTEIQFNNIKTIEQLEQKIDKYIYRYNYRRVQHKLKTPPAYYR